MVNRDKAPSIPVAGAKVPPLSVSDPLGLSCGPEGCASTCCKNGSPIVLNPYEISMICRGSGQSYEDLLDSLESGRANGFPLVMLPRFPACHFWTEDGCRIYDARPLACRLFPLGRVFFHGRSYIVLPKSNVCTGIEQSPDETVGAYLSVQNVDTYIEMADQWIDFVSDMESVGLADKPVTSVIFHMLVYSPDTPPASGPFDSHASAEELFLLRLRTARDQIPLFLSRA